jgi:hypothetical protein
MMWQSLLIVASSLGEDLQILRTPDDWQQAHFRRAISTAYYAMFHALLENNADMLYGRETSQPKSPGWTAIYRALSHTRAKSKLAAGNVAGFPDSITDFAVTFLELQLQRENADYNPNATFSYSDTINTINRATNDISNLFSTSDDNLKALAAHLLFDNR